MLKGTYTAIVTPFTTDGNVDYDKFAELINMQAEAGIDGIVPVGTTGEAPSVTYDEHIKIIKTAVEASAGRMQVIAGTGANSTAEALELTEKALKAGADATLQVTPYYNKPNQEGLYLHFSKVADLGLPVVLYNVPGRTGREIGIDTIARLSEHPHITAVKEAGGSVDRVSAILNKCEITVLSGDDSLALPMMSVGASGVISVASNMIPKPLVELTHFALEGNWDKALEIHRKYYQLFCDIFIDTNPIPIKAAMAMTGLIEEVYRLPMCKLSDTNKEVLKETMQASGLL
jgi:4-hydroxy-tetrahydrodipicolinate synthase